MVLETDSPVSMGWLKSATEPSFTAFARLRGIAIV